MSKVIQHNGIVSELHYQNHTDVLTHRTTQPNENLILERNHELRKQPEAFAKNDYFHQIASIPVIMFEKAIRDGYDLTCKDPKIAEKELFRFLRSAEGQLCMVREEKV